MTVLKKQNRKIQIMMMSDQRVAEQKRPKKYTDQRYAAGSIPSGFKVISGKENADSNTYYDTNHAFSKRSGLTQYEQIKRLAKEGIDQYEIQRRLDIPKAEIDFVLKFERLNRISKAHMTQDSQKVANLMS